MEKRNLYVVAAVVVVAVIVLAALQLTGRIAYGPCKDTDGGDDEFVRGTISDNYREYSDYCYAKSGYGSKIWLNEYFCLDTIRSKNVKCENGCSNGACLK